MIRALGADVKEVFFCDGALCPLFGVCDRVCRIAHGKHVDGVGVLRQVEFIDGDAGVKMAHPADLQPYVDRLHHHLVGNYGRVDLRGIHGVVFARPGNLLFSAYQKDQRRSKDASVLGKIVRCLGGFLFKDGGVADDHASGVVVAGRGRQAAGLDNLRDLLVLNEAVLVVAARIMSKGKVGKGHGPSFRSG